MSDVFDIGIIAVLPEEYDAIRGRLIQPQLWPGTKRTPNSHAWETGWINSTCLGGEYRVVLGMPSKAGPDYIQPVVEQTSTIFKPEFIFLCGIACGSHFNGVQNGDLIISEQVWGYEYGKIDESGFHPRSDNTYRADSSLLALANAFKVRYQPSNVITTALLLKGRLPKVHVGPLGSGYKVIDDVDNEFVKSIFARNPRVLGFEMEGIGASVCIYHLQSRGKSPRFLMIRSASDVPNRPLVAGEVSGTAERDLWKPLASAIAADAVIQLVEAGLPIRPSKLRRREGDHSVLPKRLVDWDLRGKVIKAEGVCRRFMQQDGGIAAACIGDGGGCWTTASWLEALLMKPLTSVPDDVINTLAEFLLRNQNADGGWPTVTATSSSAAPTGHAYCALLLLAKSSVQLSAEVKDNLPMHIATAKAKVKAFLHQAYQLSLADIFYTLRSWLLVESMIGEEETVNRLLKQIHASRLPNGCWSNADSYDPCPSNTARALWLLAHFGHIDQSVLNKAVKQICGMMVQGRGWPLSIQRIVLEGRVGETIVHNNSNCDVLNLVRVIEKIPQDFWGAYEWLISSQTIDGWWKLSQPGHPSAFVQAITWPTSEFVFTLKTLIQSYER